VLALLLLLPATAARASTVTNGMLAYQADSRPQESYGDQRAKVFAINLDGTGLSPLTSRTLFSSLDGDPEFSPDGNHLAYAERNTGKIQVVDADGANERYLVDGRAPAWSPDGRTIAYIGTFTYPDHTTTDALYLVDADGAHPRLLRTPTGCGIERATWTPDSAKIFYFDGCGTGVDADRAWWLVDVASGTKTKVRTAFDDSCVGDQGYSMGPDGTYAIMSCAIGRPSYTDFDLERLDFATGDLTDLTPTSAAPDGNPGKQEYSPEVSPDGTQIAYMDGNAAVWRIPIAGGTPVRVTNARPYAGYLSWQPCVAGVTRSCSPPPAPPVDDGGGGDGQFVPPPPDGGGQHVVTDPPWVFPETVDPGPDDNGSGQGVDDAVGSALGNGHFAEFPGLALGPMVRLYVRPAVADGTLTVRSGRTVVGALVCAVRCTATVRPTLRLSGRGHASAARVIRPGTQSLAMGAGEASRVVLRLSAKQRRLVRHAARTRLSLAFAVRSAGVMRRDTARLRVRPRG
jgi:Tol biopolymer transport system component